MATAQIADLVLLGLDEADARIYLALLAEDARTDEVVATLVDATASAVRASFIALNEAGLVSLAGNGTVATLMRPTGGEPVGHLIEVVNRDAVSERVRQLERGVHNEVCYFDSPPYYTEADVNEVELDNLARGVRYRVVPFNMLSADSIDPGPDYGPDWHFFAAAKNRFDPPHILGPGVGIFPP